MLGFVEKILFHHGCSMFMLSFGFSIYSVFLIVRNRIFPSYKLRLLLSFCKTVVN
jgi:hypothetical protein